ncbi:DNA-directed RNA polymerase I and III polypeptide [Tothia fuscella]|uniref:DNA-directed RNA polymerases I and III subunit RPAC2 n=1 Tax=Tothia fuscella TaxID=1048955 RepID=A0A9P4P0Z2_9PEZI|nr:DNA-directed RNA polymerase I and III polypeptide [Tothia fuscella]
MSQPQDEEMDDAPTAPEAEDQNGEGEGEDEDDEPVQQLIRVLPGATETAASFEFKEEDHTLGNALRHIIMKNPDVEFCGYSIPHPSEAKMHLRIQTYDDQNVQDVLEKGLDDLMALCDVVVEKFTIAQEEYKATAA